MDMYIIEYPVCFQAKPWGKIRRAAAYCARNYLKK